MKKNYICPAIVEDNLTMQTSIAETSQIGPSTGDPTVKQNPQDEFSTSDDWGNLW